MMTKHRAAAVARKAMVVEADTERGLVMRILLHSPKDLVAGALALAAIGAIVANALVPAVGASSVADVWFGCDAAGAGTIACQPIAAPASGGGDKGRGGSSRTAGR